jgi:hypothetical protein
MFFSEAALMLTSASSSFGEGYDERFEHGLRLIVYDLERSLGSTR